ncbi:hypothetical protein DCM91_12900 [Chitinophaga costaii]|nr:hypothetical protein DCM91_12900 [Chitinophaga costaii]
MITVACFNNVFTNIFVVKCTILFVVCKFILRNEEDRRKQGMGGWGNALVLNGEQDPILD